MLIAWRLESKTSPFEKRMITYEDSGTLYKILLLGLLSGAATVGSSWEFLQHVKKKITRPRNPAARYIVPQMKKPHTEMFIVSSCLKPTQHPSTDDR